MFDVIVEPLKIWAEGVILSGGYGALFFLMLLDSLNIPIPSEAIMPFGGILAGEGKLVFWMVAAAGSAGTIVGSCVNYWIGMKLGVEGLRKYGKYILIREKDVQHGEDWFNKHGEWVALWGRFIPIVRTFISLPAGIYRMNFFKFLLFAILGAVPWCTGWAYLGYKMGQQWSKVGEYWHYVDYVVAAVLLFLIFKFVVSRFKREPEAA